MPHGRTFTTRRRARTALVTVMVLFGAAVGVLQPAAARADDPVQPTISDAYAVPFSLPWDGGTVTVTATLESPAGIANAYYTVFLANSGSAGATMTETPVGSGSWSGDVAIPPNYDFNGVSHPFQITVAGNDGGTNQAFAGSIYQDGQPQFNQAPYVQIDTVDPSSLSSDGGSTVSIWT